MDARFSGMTDGFARPMISIVLARLRAPEQSKGACTCGEEILKKRISLGVCDCAEIQSAIARRGKLFAYKP
jgi:hypothetical protein